MHEVLGSILGTRNRTVDIAHACETIGDLAYRKGKYICGYSILSHFPAVGKHGHTTIHQQKQQSSFLITPQIPQAPSKSGGF